MSIRITKKFLDRKLNILANELGKTIGTKKGQLYLHYQSGYGGYIVVEFINDQGGEYHPLINCRVKANEMCNILDACIALKRTLVKNTALL
jgi:hypothetical protein